MCIAASPSTIVSFVSCADTHSPRYRLSCFVPSLLCTTEKQKNAPALTTTNRIFIVMATLLTWPLAMQPVSTVLGRGLIAAGFGVGSSSVRENGYGAIGALESGTAGVSAASGTVAGVPGPVQIPVDAYGNGKPSVEGNDDVGGERLSPAMYYGLRAVLVIFCGVCATSVPNFGVVVSLLGSFSVTLGSFVLPPLFHFLVFRGKQKRGATAIDVGLFVLGVMTCVFTTASTALGVINGDV